MHERTGDMPETQLSAAFEDFCHEPFARFLGLEIEHLEVKRALVRFPARPEVLNLRGITHGGAISALIDDAAFLAVRSFRAAGQILTLEKKVNFTAPARGDLWAEATVEHAGRTVAMVSIRVWDGAKKLVALGTSTFLLGRD